MILNSTQIKAHSKEVGAKTLNLLKLLELGFEVPAFLTIGSSHISQLFKSKEEREKTSEEIHNTLNASSYAVRSSALIEDSASESMAGQFHTEINVDPKTLAEAIQKVLLQANEKKAIDQFSLIIQEFIEPETAGVTFTRNPLGGREMIIESYKGRGEALVSGQIKPEHFTFYSSEKFPSNLPLTETQIEAFKKIETAFGFPQDIEWCLKAGKLYLLQTRPITTVNSAQFEEIKTLETLLPKKDESFYFEKTEISEIAPRPKPFLMSLIQSIYAQNGPVSQVYKVKSIHYQDTVFLKLIGNELYVDKERELHSLLPAYSILGRDFLPHFQSFLGSWTTFKNILALAKLKGDKAGLLKTLKQHLSFKTSLSDLRAQVDDFLETYKIIFEVNLMAGTAINNLETALKREKISILEALSFPQELFLKEEERLQIDFYEKDLKGNSLNMDDETPFSKTETAPRSSDMKLWEGLPSWKKTYLRPFIANALFWQHLREMGRWLTVKKINELKEVLKHLTKEKKLSDPKLIYFFNLNELLESKANEKLAKERKKNYESYSKYSFPQKLTDHFQLSNQSISGLSPGVATGNLVDIETLKKQKGKKILYTETLLPELTQYFPDIEGIVSKTGGLLSHLAIVAREKGLPIVINVNLTQEKIKIGDRIRIDGDTGNIEKLEN